MKRDDLENALRQAFALGLEYQEQSELGNWQSTDIIYEEFEDHLEKVCKDEHKSYHYTQLLEALQIIAAPRRVDGTWNRDREGCRQLAMEVLGNLR